MAQALTSPSRKPHKQVRWRKPQAGGRRPTVLDVTTKELVRGLELRQGSLWFRVAKHAIVAGYAINRALDRVRGLRRDGADSLLAMTVALLYCTDIRTGFVGKPRALGQRWQRYSLADLCQLAYGAQGEAELRRGRRALDVMTGLGWINPTRQVRRHQGDGQFTSEPAVRRMNLQRLCEMTGTGWLLKRDRQHADRTKPQPVPTSIDKARRQHQNRQRLAGDIASALQRPAAVSTTETPAQAANGPPRGPTSLGAALEHILEINKLFD